MKLKGNGWLARLDPEALRRELHRRKVDGFGVSKVTAYISDSASGDHGSEVLPLDALTYGSTTKLDERYKSTWLLILVTS